MSHKSGFELRTEILGMAMNLLEENRAQTNQFYAMELEQRAGEKLPIIEIEQVIDQAQKLYEFVTEK